MNDHHDAAGNVRLEILREAALRGIADIEAGRFSILETPAALVRHITLLAEEAIGPRARSGKGPSV